ncbi:katanin p80 WD40 repeat-containing subunit B1-like isoform X2 [Daphnia carinata]|uniref:katanin p80 WD40 repeat-containing subunit B1-like isoform X2 n=1 Tax=Daphnia carinata TaxID=120202 RepID=UPI00257AF455|nr:katanin p80 WD40 repeat-containing subunit B1-like isoform X2 [Daphnia carinata]
MATTTKRAWKLQEFSAHGANVNCLSLGSKSGRVLVTGGDDKKVNLWAIGKPSCIMSLSGHTTAIEAVRFSPTEELVCAGSAAGAVKVWDLEAARMVRTLTGHRAGIKALDFHPYGDFLATGSTDTNIKLWDIRRKGCIFTYKGHSSTVNSLRFSPDGQWVASAGDDGYVKIWDLRAGRLLSELREHTAAVTEVVFHPHEFLLASGAADRRVLFWDLENFTLVSNSDPETSGIRSIYFHPEGKCLFSAAQDGLRVYGWEPCRILDCIPLPWGRIQDMAVTSSQLIGVSYNLSNVSIYVIDLKKVAPFGDSSQSSSGLCGGGVGIGGGSGGGMAFQHGQSFRKSFNKERPPGGVRQSQIKTNRDTIESDEKSSTETEDDGIIATEEFNQYHDVFPPRGREYTAIPHVIRPPPPDLVQQHSPLPTPASGNSPVHRPSPSPSPPYVKTPQSGPGRPAAGFTTMRERRNSTSSVTVSSNKNITSISSVERESYNVNLHTPTNLIAMTSPRPDVTHLSGGPPVLPPTGPHTSRGRSLHRNLIHRKDSIKEVLQPSLSDPENPPKLNNIRHSPSEPSLSMRSHSTSRSSSLTRNRPDLTVPVSKGRVNSLYSPFMTSQSPVALHQDYVPVMTDKLTGLDLEDFMPRKFNSLSMGGGSPSVSGMSSPYEDSSSLALEQTELEVVTNIVQGHQPMMTVLSSRHRNLQVVYNLWQNKDAKVAVETAVNMNDPAVVVDLLSVIIFRPFLWSLDLCVLLLPAIADLLQSKFEVYVNTACNSLRLVLKNFATVIKSNIETPTQSVGVDISRQERFNKCMSCYSQLVPIKAFVLKRQAMAGKMGQTFRELHILLQVFD